MKDLDLIIFNFLNGGANYYPYLDTFFILLTSYFAYAFSLGVGMYVLFVVPYQRRIWSEKLRAIRQGLEFFLTAGFTWFAVFVIKNLVARPRPFLVIENVKMLLPNESGYSFPSGHASLTFAVATTVFLHHKRLGIYLYAFALIVALSRIYVGVHYPSDVLAGAAVGIIVSVIVHKIVPKIFRLEL